MTPETGPQETYKEGLLVGYRWFDAKKMEPQYPFGFGLSYTTFEFSPLGFTSVNLMAGKPQVVGVGTTVTNTGQREGAVVVQVYVEPVKPSVERPIKELKAFTKVMLKPGQRTSVITPLSAEAFAYYSPEKHAWIAEAGDYVIHVGDSSRSLPLRDVYHLEKTIEIPEAVAK